MLPIIFTNNNNNSIWEILTFYWCWLSKLHVFQFFWGYRRLPDKSARMSFIAVNRSRLPLLRDTDRSKTSQIDLVYLFFEWKSLFLTFWKHFVRGKNQFLARSSQLSRMVYFPVNLVRNRYTHTLKTGGQTDRSIEYITITWP